MKAKQLRTVMFTVLNICLVTGCSGRGQNSVIASSGDESQFCADQESFSDCSATQMRAALSENEQKLAQDEQTEDGLEAREQQLSDEVQQDKGLLLGAAEETAVKEAELKKLEKELEALKKEIEILTKRVELLRLKLQLSSTTTTTPSGLVACVGYSRFDNKVQTCTDQNPSMITKEQCEADNGNGLTWKRMDGKECKDFPTGSQFTAISSTGKPKDVPANKCTCGIERSEWFGNTQYLWCVNRTAAGRVLAWDYTEWGDSNCLRGCQKLISQVACTP